MYSKMFELINDKINSLIDDSPITTLELKKIEIKGIKVKLVFLDTKIMKIQIMRYEMDWFSTDPILKFKKVYLKPFNDKYFR